MPVTQAEVEAILAEDEAPPPTEAEPRQPVTVDEVQSIMDEDEREQDAFVGSLFQHSLRQPPADRHGAILEVARRTRAPANMVERHFDDFKRTAELVQFDPRKWRQANPDLANLLLERPDLAPVVIKEKEIPWYIAEFRKYRAAISYFEEAADKGNRGFKPEELDALTAKMDHQFANASKPVPTPTVESPLAQATGLDRLAIFADAYGHASKGVEHSQIGAQILARKAVGAETWDLEKQAVDLERDLVARDYAAGPVEQVILDSIEVGRSQVETLKGFGAGGLLGAAGGAAVGGVVSRSAAGAKAGAKVGFGIGSRIGSAAKSFELESGGAYLDFRKMKTDQGETVDDSIAVGAAIAYGAAAALVETAVLNPFESAVQAGAGRAFIQNMIRDPSARAVLMRAGKEWVKGSVGEGVEEFTQSLLEDLAGHAAKVATAGTAQKADVGAALDKAVEAGVKATVGTAVLGGVTGGARTVTSIVADSRARSRALRAGEQVSAISEMSKTPLAKASPEAVAQLIEKETADSGEPVTHLYVDPGAFTRLFQSENGGDPDEAAKELLGEEGPAKLKEAQATGGKLEIPLAEYMEKWGGKPIAEALSQDTTTRPGHMTPRELAEQQAEVERQAQEIAKEAEKGLAPEGSEADFATTLEEQLRKTGTYTEAQTRQAIELQRAFIRTQAARFGVPADKLFSEFLISAQREGQQTVAAPLVEPVFPAASEALTKRLGAEMRAPEARAGEYFIDSVTGLRNERAFDATPAPAGKQVAVITSPTIKAINDAPEGGGHHVADAMLRVMAAEVFKIDQGAARNGTNLILHVADQAELNTLLQKIREAVKDPAISIEGQLGANRKETGKALGDRIDKMREAGKLPPRNAPVPGLDVKGLKFEAQPVAGQVPAPLIQSIRDLSDEAYFRKAYKEEGTGLLTAEGWNGIARKAHVAAFDLRGLRALNDKYGKEAGDELLHQFGSLARDLLGADFDFAHLHGDEYAAQHDDLGALEGFIDLLREATDHLVRVSVAEGDQRLKYRSEGFWHGLGERSYEAADADLNKRKRAAKEQEGSPRGVPSGQGVRDAVGDGGVRQAVPAGSERPGAANQAPGDRDQRRDDVAARREALRRRARSQGFASSPRIGVVGPGVTKTRVEQGHRGYTDIYRVGVQRIFDIVLGKKADLTTFLHESAHTFLEMMGDLSEREDAPAAMKEDFAQTLKWLGVESRGDIKVEQHEKWARAFEAYLLEGNEPAERLRRTFNRFRLWLKSVYRSIRDLNVEINDDIRGVFDRLLATDDEIARAEQRMGLTPPLFRSPEEAGMTAEQWQTYLDEQEDARSRTSRSAELRALKDRLRETERWWKEEEAVLRDQVALEYEQQPARRAQLILRGKSVDEKGKERKAAFIAEPIKLDRTAVTQAVGEEGAKRFATVKVGGIHPDIIAPTADFATGPDMLRAILGLQEKESWVRETAAARMRERHPDIIEDREQLRTLIEKGLHGEFTAQWLMREWAVLREKAYVLAENPEANTVQAIPKERLGMKPPPIEAIKRAAQLMAERRQVQRLDAGRSLQAERQAAEKAAAAAARGDFAQAYVFKQQQLLNMYLWKALDAAREERDAMLELASDLRKDRARARLGKANPAFRDGIDAILEAIALKDVPDPTPTRLSLDATIEAMGRAGQTVMFELEPLKKLEAEPRSWKTLTVAELRNVFVAVKSIKQAATVTTTALVEGKRLDREMVIEKLVNEAISNRKDRGPLSSSDPAETVFQRGLSIANELDGSMLRPERMLLWLGGEDLKSTWFQAVVKPLQDAKIREADILRTAVQPIIEAFEKIPASIQARAMERIDGKKLFPTHRSDLSPPSRRFELLMLALNAGNASNLERLTLGRNISLDEVRGAIDLLEKEEMDWVQSIWDASEKLWPEAKALEERESGLAPPKIEPQPLATRHGVYPGGYYNAAYDRRVEFAGERSEARDLADILDPSFVRPGTSHGHLKSRVEGFTGAVSLEPRKIIAQFARVAHDLAYREALKSVANLVLDERVDATMKRHLGDGKTKQFRKWLQDIGGMSGAELPDMWSKIGSTLRRNQIAAALAYRIPTMLGDFGTMIYAGLKSSPVALASGLREMFVNPRACMRLAMEKSGELRARDGQLSERFKTAISSLTQRGGRARQAYESYLRHGFTMYEWTEKLWSTPVWIGEYRRGLKAGKSEADAILHADKLVRDILPTHRPVDQAGVQRNRYLAPMVVFYSFHSVVWNELRGHFEPFMQALGIVEKGKKAAVGAAASLVLLFSAYALGEFLSGRGPESGDGEDEAERWANWLKRKMLLGALQPVPFGGEVAGVIEGKLMGHRTNPRAGIFTSMLEPSVKAAEKMLDDDKEWDEQFKAFIRAIGPLAGIPMYPFTHPGQYLVDVAQGEQESSGLADVASGLIYGARDDQPANPLSILSGGAE